MRILMVTAPLSVPPQDGYSLRCYRLAEQLARRGCQIHLAAAGPPRMSMASDVFASVHVAATGRLGALQGVVAMARGRPYHVGTYATLSLAKTIADIVNRTPLDVVYAHFIYFSEILAALYPVCSDTRPLIVLDQHNFDRDMWKERADSERRPLVRALARANLRLTERFEQRAYRLYDLVVSVSERDRLGTQTIQPGLPVVVVPNGTDVHIYDQAVPPSQRTGRVILFVGSPVAMNTQAVEWFGMSVFPLVRRVVPDAQFHIVGIPRAAIATKVLRMPGVTAWGRVPSVGPHYSAARVFVAPFFVGGGSKLKVLEAFAARCPVVSTKQGVVGLDAAVPGIHFELAEDARAFAEKCIKLLTDDSRADAVALAARAMVQNGYDWSLVGERLYEQFRSTLLSRGSAMKGGQ